VFGSTDLLLIALVLAQITLYITLFAIPSHTGRWAGGKWLPFYFIVSIGIYLAECRMDSAFHWAVGFYLGQLLALPWRISIPATIVLFAGYFLTAFGWRQLAHFSAWNWFIALSVVAAWTGFLLFFHRVLATSSERGKLIAELEAAQRELERARQRDAELAVLQERERLARDLHDSLGHSLVTLTVQLEAVQRLLAADPARAASVVAEMQKLTRSSMEDLRRSLANLRAPGLGERPLAGALRELCADAGKRSGIAPDCHIAEGADQLPPVVAEVLWRVAQEGLTNVEKHARARRVQVGLTLQPNEVLMRVGDDGVGLPADAEDKPGHYGLRGLRERVEGVGGTFTLTRAQPAGTLVEARVPLIG
jgi:signal transduction histidine kinase